MNNLYESIDVWEKVSDNSVAIYRIFKRISDGFYSVQSKDFFYMNKNFKEQAEYFLSQKVSLFCEMNIDKREKFYKSIEICITEYNKEFDY